MNKLLRKLRKFLRGDTASVLRDFKRKVLKLEQIAKECTDEIKEVDDTIRILQTERTAYMAERTRADAAAHKIRELIN